MLTRIAGFASRRPWWIVGPTIAFVLVAGAVGAPVIAQLTTGSADFQNPSAPNVAAEHRLERATNADPNVAVIAVVQPGVPVTSTAGVAKVAAVARVLARDPAVASVSRFDPRNRFVVSRDRRATYLTVLFKPISDKAQVDAAKRLEKEFSGRSDVLLGGPAVASDEINTRVADDLRRAELFAAPLLFLLSLLFFRGLVAALLPIACAVVAILGSFLVLRVVTTVAPLSIFATNLITGLGIGLGIDYSLFIVSRYREELLAVGPGAEALKRTMATAGRTVAFSALTVAAGMAALFAFPQRFLYSMAVGGVAVAIIGALAAVVFLPGLLALLGPRVNALAPKRWQIAVQRTAAAEQAGPWYRLSHFVMRHAGLVAAVSAAVMLVLGIPFFKIAFTGADATVLPGSATARQVQDVLDTRFGQNRSSPIYVAVAATPAQAAAVRSLAVRYRQLPQVLAVSPPQRVSAATWRIDVISRYPDLAGGTQTLVHSLRSVATPLATLVGGNGPAYVDQQDNLKSRLPIGLAIAAGTTLILLFLVTGSVILPIKAVIMNILTIAATLGSLVWVFQDGRLESVFGYTSEHAINSTQPILIAAVAFALGTDYAVFLLTRIKEARATAASDTEAVARGMERTGRIITAAALLLAVAIGAFVSSQIVLIKELGFGIALAVLLDATIVRTFLVPSLMFLLGKWNWWAPPTLRRVYERFEIREGEPAPPPTVVDV
jgi:uncharacterized membrane protein YdfJ with MMPL/SSD domain